MSQTGKVIRISCICGHSKSNHKELMKEGERMRGECEQWNCRCEKYVISNSEKSI